MEAIVDRGVRAVLGRAIPPPATGLENMQDAEALAPAYASALRTGGLLAFGLALSVLAVRAARPADHKGQCVSSRKAPRASAEAISLTAST